MTSFRGAVYDPPGEGFPTLAVAFAANGDVLLARCMENRQQAEALLAQIKAKIEATIAQETAGRAA
jgi:hypothetical protein